MRKNIIALMLALPLLFVLVVFSSGNVASLGVTVSATGIQILEKPENNTLLLDLASYENDYALTVEISPANASDKSYSFRVEEIEGSGRADIEVDEAGRITAHSPGAARVVAVSGDGGFTDSIAVVVGSSKPFDFAFYLSRAEGSPVALSSTEKGYAASVSTGLYSYRTVVEPSGFAGAKLACTEGFAVINEAAGNILLPFGGEARLSATVENGWQGDIVKEITLSAAPIHTSAGFTVNGGADATLAFERGTRTGSFYVESPEAPTVEAPSYVEGYEVTKLEGGEGRYRVDLSFAEACESEFSLDVCVGGSRAEVTVSFLPFAFDVRADLPVQGAEELAVLVGSPVTFYAYPSLGMKADGVTYEWTTDAEDRVTLTPAEGGASCTVQAAEGGSFALTVRAMRGGKAIDINPQELEVKAVRKVSEVLFADDYNTVDLVKRTTIGGYAYEGEALVARKTPLRVAAYDVGGRIDGVSDLEISLSDSRIARLEYADGGVLLVPTGTGEVTVSAEWQGNGSFGTSVRASVIINVVSSAVEVCTSPQLYRAAAEKRPIVLTADLLLGTDEAGAPLSEETRAAMLAQNTLQSTYNIHYYTSRERTEDARVKYAIEFKNNVYGNGHTLNAEYFTNVKDGSSSQPKQGFFRGPLYFVSLGEAASVAGQDNIAYLVRTKGVVLSGLTLLGCSDASLFSEETGENDLTKLNNTGTTLEINADASLLNCRVRNGRNVVRAYGGNKNGDRYFIESLNGNVGCDDERILVRIEGCVLSNAREFILKLGANRALRARTDAPEPDLCMEDGTPYRVQTNVYLNDPYFYEKYVMTDVTLKNSVLETSGLFTVGVESNFAGTMLGPESPLEGWAGAGGTSFASILRLEGDVRLYDWKRLDLVDSSTLIETSSDGGLSINLKLDIAGMLNHVCKKQPEKYGDIILEREDAQYVHGGIAFYGGGKNYSQLSTSGLDAARSDFSTYLVNISVLADSEDEGMQTQGKMLPNAAGTQDFRFYMYGKNSANSYENQLTAPRYDALLPVPLF